MQKITVEQWEFLKKLSKELPSHYTLKDVLNRDDLNPHKKELVPIEDVEFTISGILQYAYECTGEKQEYRGTIKEIITDLVTGDDMFNSENDESLSEQMVKIKDIWSEEDINELAKFFLGKRDETHLDKVKATSNREVSLNEIADYIRELDVINDFEYKHTLLQF